jgi:hypothetical protein
MNTDAGLKLLRDLEWVWSRPHFVQRAWDPQVLDSAFFERHQADFLKLISQCQKDLAPLMGFLAGTPRTYKLGLYAQALFEFVLRNLPGVRVLMVDEPCRVLSPQGARTTEGALDFLIHDQRVDHFIHIEFAVKVMLRKPVSGRPEVSSDWIGPEGRDRLDLKLGKLHKRQLPLSRHPYFSELLRARYQLEASQIESVTVLRGLGFVEPEGAWQSTVIDPSQIVGEWWPVDQWGAVGRGEWKWIPKRDWLSEVSGLELTHFESLSHKNPRLGIIQSVEPPLQRAILVHTGWPVPQVESLI